MKGIHNIALDGQTRTLAFTLEGMASYGEATGNPEVKLFPDELSLLSAVGGNLEDLTTEQRLPVLSALIRFCRELVYMGLLGDSMLTGDVLTESRQDIIRATVGMPNAELVGVFTAYSQSQAVGESVRAGLKAIEDEGKKDQKKRRTQATRPALSPG